MTKIPEYQVNTYIVERVDLAGRIITGYQQEVQAEDEEQAVDLWSEYYDHEYYGVARISE